MFIEIIIILIRRAIITVLAYSVRYAGGNWNFIPESVDNAWMIVEFLLCAIFVLLFISTTTLFLLRERTVPCVE